MSIIKEHAEAISAILHRLKTPKPKHRRQRSILDIVLADGLDFTSTMTTDPALRGKMKECFQNAGRLALFGERGRYIYCEGFAVPSEQIPLPIAHAWVWDIHAQKAIDVTWEQPGIEYFGIAFDTEWFRNYTIEQNVWGVLDQPAFMYDEAKPEDYRANSSDLLVGQL